MYMNLMYGLHQDVIAALWTMDINHVDSPLWVHVGGLTLSTWPLLIMLLLELLLVA